MTSKTLSLIEQQLSIAESRTSLLKRMKEIFQEPGAEELAREILGTSSEPSKTKANHSTREVRMKAGQLKSGVIQTLEGATRALTTIQIVSAMTTRGYVFGGARPDTSVNTILKQLKDEGFCVVVGKVGKYRLWVRKNNPPFADLLAHSNDGEHDA